MFPWDQDAMHAPRPGVNMPLQDPDVDPFAERTDDDIDDADWQISSESEDMPNSDAAMAIDAPMIEQDERALGEPPRSPWYSLLRSRAL